MSMLGTTTKHSLRQAETASGALCTLVGAPLARAEEHQHGCRTLQSELLRMSTFSPQTGVPIELGLLTNFPK
eukprot:6229334-Alexandrium_andersonii.AAC.1